MANKVKQHSINTVIYLLLGAMLISIVGVSVYTVSSRRREETPVDTSDTSAPVTQAPETSRPTVKSPETTAPADTTAAPETTASAPAKKPAETTAPAKTDKPASISVRYFVQPVVGAVGKEFEIDVPVYSMTMNDYRAHTGIDLTADIGSEVVAASSGIVCRVWNDPLMGRSVTIDHGDGIYTTYKNLADTLAAGIEAGAGVNMGQTLGAIGETALIEIAEEPHLHFEMKVDGLFVDPLDYIAADAGVDGLYED